MRKVAIGAAALGSLVAAYWVGYRTGLSDKAPDRRALVTVRRTAGATNSLGHSFTWYDVKNPWDASRLLADEARLTALGVEHYVTEGVVSVTVDPLPDPRHVDSHR